MLGMQRLNQYAVYYETDGHVTKVLFTLPVGFQPDMIILVAAGILFEGDCCPGEPWCVVQIDPNFPEKVILPQDKSPSYYGWSDGFSEDDEPTVYTYGDE